MSSRDARLPPDRLSRWLHAGIVCLVMSVIGSSVASTVADCDLWGHLKFGQDIRRAGRVIQTDSYSYLAGGRAWINHEWLAEVVFSLVFDRAGAPGLIALKVAISLLIFGLVYRHLCRQGLDPLEGGMVLIAVSVLLAVWLRPVRPQIFTYLFFLLVLLLIHRTEHGPGHWLGAAPLLVALWVNLHGGFLAGIGIFWLWAAVHVVTAFGHGRRPGAPVSPSTRAVSAAALASLLATLANPYGARLGEFLLRTATVARPEISEWDPIRVMSVEGASYLVWLAIVSAGVIGSRRARRPALMAILASAALLPLIAFRHTPLFALASVVLGGEHLADARNRWLGGCRAGAPRTQAWIAGLAFTGAAAFGARVPADFQCIRVAFPCPARAIALLRRSEVRGNLAIHFNWGEYAIWHLGPRIKVSVDGRRETVYSDAVYAEDLRFRSGMDRWDAILQRPETDMALVSREWVVFHLMELKPGWIRVYDDSLCGLFVRQGSPLVGRIQGTVPPEVPDNCEGRCFP